MFGLRGLDPDREISGFETAFNEIAPRLVERGHSVTIYCRAAAYSPARRIASDRGVTLRYMPSPGGKNFSAVTSTALAVAHALPRREFDVWFFVNVGMGHHAAIARLSGAPVVMNVDGLDWQRAKWGPLARGYFYSAAQSAVRYCTTLVTDAEAMRSHYRDHFKRESEMIAYGATVETSTEPHHLAPFELERRGYYLIVSRLVPENSLGVMLEGFLASRTKRRLIVVGGSHYRDAFHRDLESIAARDPRIHLVGQISNQKVLKELWCNCYGYLHGHSVGGTNPALLRAMGYGACVLARDTVFNREVLGNAGLFFEGDPAIVAKLVNHLDATPALADLLRERSTTRIRDRYSWDKIVDQYEHVFTEAVARRRSAR